MRTSWLIAVLPGLVQPLHAQTASISARQAISDFVSNGSPVQRAQAFATARGILQQEKGAVPRAVIDSVADALARVALRAGGADVHEGSRAIAAIQLGGSSEARVPYPAFTSLKRIATEAADIGIRGAALGAMGGITQKNEALAFLSEVARSQGAARRQPGDPRAADHRPRLRPRGP